MGVFRIGKALGVAASGEFILQARGFSNIFPYRSVCLFLENPLLKVGWAYEVGRFVKTSTL